MIFIDFNWFPLAFRRFSLAFRLRKFFHTEKRMPRSRIPENEAGSITHGFFNKLFHESCTFGASVHSGTSGEIGCERIFAANFELLFNDCLQ